MNKIMATPMYIQWFIKSSNKYQTKDGKTVEVWEFKHNEDETILKEWAYNFRQNYISNNELNILTENSYYKYGLTTNKEICIYELGFTDRCLVQELKQFVDEEYDKDIIKFDLLKRKDSVLEVLSKYPSYFENVFERLNY